MANLFVIIDGHALAYRHFFATQGQPLSTRDGEPTGATLGFTRTLMDIMKRDNPKYIAVSFDAGLSGRDELYDEYKAHRDAMPDELAVQINRLHEIVRAFNVPILKLPGYEADDVIGTISRQAEAQDENVTVRIVTGDKDLLQLMTDYVEVYLQRTFGADTLYTPELFREEYEGLEPPQLVDIKALEGDSSDNIPGVRGVGKKTARPLIKTYGTLENLYAHLDEVKGRARSLLEKNRESAFLSKELARIRCDLDITLNLADCATHDYDPNEVASIFEELEFRSLLRRLLRKHEDDPTLDEETVEVPEGTDFDEFAAPTLASELVKPYAVTSEAGLQKVVDMLSAAAMISFDTEATGTDPTLDDLVGISLAVDGDSGYYIPVAHIDAVEDQLQLETVIEALRGPLTNPNIPKVAHNASYDVVILQRYGLDVTPVTFDTMIAEWVRDSGSNALSLSNLAMERDMLYTQMQDIKDLIGTGKKQITMAAVPITKAAPYAAEDAAITYRLVEPLRKKLARHDPSLKVFEELEMPLVPVIAAIEQVGVAIDVPYLGEMSGRLDERLRGIEQEIYGLSGGYGEFNINSPKQLNDVLFGKLGLPTKGIRKTTHGYSTAADVLDRLYEDTGNELLKQILAHRELTKLKGTYVDALPELINPRTGRLHTSFNQTGSVTGRLSSSKPNLQNIPIRTEIGREVRRAFITAPTTVLLSVDYSQVELRIVASMADEPTLKQAFRDGQDIHATTAAVVYGVPLDEVTYEQRSFAKRVNFGLLYGMGAFRLARDSNLTLAEADEFVKTYFQRLPNIQRYIEETKAQLRSKGYVETLFGRRRYFGDVRKMSRNEANRAEREAINMPVQGTAADIIKRAMIDLHAALNESKLGARMTLQVHDELVLEVPENELDDTARLVVAKMEEAYEMDPPLRANAQFGSNWRDMESVTL